MIQGALGSVSLQSEGVQKRQLLRNLQCPASHDLEILVLSALKIKPCDVGSCTGESVVNAMKTQ